MSWRDDYQRRFVSTEEAAKTIKSGDRVAFAYGVEPHALGLALVARASELKGVRLFVPAPGRDFPWYEPGWEETFSVTVAHVLPVAQDSVLQRRTDYLVGGLLWAEDPGVREPVDVLLIQVSTPDEHGYCSFGASLWDKKQAVREAKTVIAEVNPHLIRTYGENFVHYSELDYLVEHVPSGRAPGSTDMLGRRTTGPGEVEKAIAHHVGTVVKDGDCLEVGVGGAAEWACRLGVLDDKHDLGWHSENTPPGIAILIKKGVVNSRRKSINTGKGVATACGGGSKEEMDFLNMNPCFELYSSRYVLDPRVISANDNVVAINSALAVDLTGQISAESIGYAQLSGTGGQLAFAIGANLSRGGRNVVVLPSTARGGTVSRIVPSFEPGTTVTVPRNLANLIVTEHGVANLKGKTRRQRAEELIAIAHPDFRAELGQAAQQLFHP
ncbi:MAG: acetyl-CoA hydrolase/transferase C-terminal domain-containing protein [Chloroflexota bacterium]